MTNLKLYVLIKFRSKCFDMAASGHRGHYSEKIESFNKEVEDGFSDDGTIWTANDGSVFSCKEALYAASQKSATLQMVNTIIAWQDNFDDWKLSDRSILWYAHPGEDWLEQDSENLKVKVLLDLMDEDNWVDIRRVNWDPKLKATFLDYNDALERGLLEEDQTSSSEPVLEFFVYLDINDDEPEHEKILISHEDAIRMILKKL